MPSATPMTFRSGPGVGAPSSLLESAFSFSIVSKAALCASSVANFLPHAATSASRAMQVASPRASGGSLATAASWAHWSGPFPPRRHLANG